MGLLERISARGRDVEQRYAADQWLTDFLRPSTMAFGGHQYPYGLTTTWDQGRVREITNTLPGYSQALRFCPPAFAAQMVRALVLSQARFTFRNLLSSRTPRRTFGTQALSILEHPAPSVTTGELLARMEWHAGLAGNAYVLRRPDRLRVLRPDWVAVLFGSHQEPEDAAQALDGELIGFVYQNGGFYSGYKPQTLLPADVAHWCPLPDPELSHIGMSWITPAVREIQADGLATDHKIQYFRNGATPNMVVRGITAATREQFNEIVDILEQQHTGVANAYRTMYLTAGADATVVGSNLAELDMKAVQGGGETRIAFLSRVPAPLLGIAEGLAGSSLNAGNFGMARRMFADTWVYPTLQDLAGSLADIVKVPSDAELWFDTQDMPILREDAKDAADIQQVKIAAIAAAITAGFDPDASVAALAPELVGVLKHTGMVSVQLQQPGTGQVPGGPPAAGDGGAPAGTNGGQARAFNKAEPRIPGGEHGGEWTHNPATAAKHAVEGLAHALGDKEFTGGGANAAGRPWSNGDMSDLAGERIAKHWKVADADLHALIREDGLWHAYEDKSPAEQRRRYAAHLAHNWAGSSGGPVAASAITAVLDARGIDYDLADKERRFVDYVRANPALHQATASLGEAMYQTTQDWFTERGITHVHAYRATRGGDESRRPWTSWSTSKGGTSLAPQFTEGRKVIEKDIAVSQILSVPGTGFGSLDELEIVVLPARDSAAGGAGPKGLPASAGRSSAGTERKFNPAEPRDPHTGEWMHAPGSGVAHGVEKLVHALEGQDALDAAPVRLIPDPNWSGGGLDGAHFSRGTGHGSARAIAEYQGLEYQQTNSVLRGKYGTRPRDPWTTDEQWAAQDAEVKKEVAARVAEIDKTMAVSRLTGDVKVHRVVKDGSQTFGRDVWYGDIVDWSNTTDFDQQDREAALWESGARPDLTGLEWREDAYVSTTVDPVVVGGYAKRYDIPQEGVSSGLVAVFNIRVPKGTGGIQLSAIGNREEGEILLQRGLRMRVVKDHGEIDGQRVLDVEVIPDGD